MCEVSMGTLNKFIFKQVATATFMTVALFVFVLVLGNVVKEVMGDLSAGRLSLSFFFYIVALIIPGVVPYALPLGMLTGILLVFGRMSAQSEVVAIKACGRSIYSMAAPVFLLAIVASIFSVAINFYYAPVANYAYKSSLKNLIRSNPLQLIYPGAFIRDFPGYVMYSDKSDGEKLLNFRLWEIGRNGNPPVFIQSKSALLTYDDLSDEIVLRLKDVWGELKGERYTYGSELEIKLPLDRIIGSFDGHKTKLKLMTFGELLKARTSWHRGADPSTLSEGQKFRDRIDVQVQIQKNFAMAFSIFSMVLLAVPLGIKASRTETFANLAIALALALSYYLLIVVISWMEKYPSLRPDLLIWIPNLIFQGSGCFLIWKSSKH